MNPQQVPDIPPVPPPRLRDRAWWPWLTRGVLVLFGAFVLGLLIWQATRVDWPAVFAAMAANPGAAFDVGAALVIGLASGYIVLQYADVKAAYPAAMTGRAMAVFTMAMFLGVALAQWFTGLIASLAPVLGLDPYAAVLATIAALLALGAAAFRWLPRPPQAA